MSPPGGFHAGATGGASTGGYLDQCYNNVSWNGSSDPTGTATAVPVTAGTTATGKNAALASAGAISGKVTAATGGGALAGVYVQVYDSTGSQVGFNITDAGGTYTVTGLAPSASGDSVCFDGNQATGGSSTAGYLDRCYNNVAWDGFSDPTGTATAVPVTGGTTATGKNAALASG